MENKTSFDLNAVIQRWRENLARSVVFRVENLEELESHLRDSITTLQASGLSAEEAFLIASRRIGDGRQLENEFRKTNRDSVWLERVLWMAVGVLAWLAANGPVSALPVNLLALGWPMNQTPGRVQGDAWPVAIFVVMRVLAIAASFWFFRWLIFRKGSQFNQWLRIKFQRRSSFVAFCVGVCLLVFSVQILVSLLPAYALWRNGSEFNGQLRNCVNWSHAIVHFPLLIGLILFALSLARKRFLIKST